MKKYIFLSIISFVVFVGTLISVKNGSLYIFDHHFSSFPHNSILDIIFFLVTDVGSWIFVTLMSCALILYLVVKNKHPELLLAFVSILSGLFLQTVLKDVLAIKRPTDSLISTVGDSFPSGHANMTTIVCLLAFVYIFSLCKSSKTKLISFVILIFIPLFVGFSRIYLRAHWPSDVLAGWALGVFCVVTPIAFYKFRHRLTVK